MFKEYNAQDVVTEAAIRRRLAYGIIPETEKRLWDLDQRINDRGVRIDIPMADTIVQADQVYQEGLLKQAKTITGLDNPNSPSQLKLWVRHQGMKCESLDKAHVAQYLTTAEDPKVKKVLLLRQLMSRTSTKKYEAMQRVTCSDGRARGCFQFYGASRSGRWAGRLLQLQNLPQNHIPDLSLARSMAKEGDLDGIDLLYGDIPDTLSQLVRTAFIPSEGCRFVVSDFSAIEARVIAWLAGESWRLEVFRQGGDIYCKSAERMFGVPVEKHGVNGHLRQRGKVAELACGYGGGVGAMKAMDRDHQIPEEELQGIVDDWRKSSPKICRLWRTYENAAKRCITEGTLVKAAHVRFTYHHSTLFLTLPSGRKLAYYRLSISPDGEITYMGVNQTTRRWEETKTWGGKLAENVTQAVARDCLGRAMLRAEEEGYRVVMHVHDEMILDVPLSDREALQKVSAIMAEPVPWAPGLPLRGDSYETPFYRKD